MQKTLTPAERLIVAVDIEPILHRVGRREVRKRIYSLALQLHKTQVTLKLNTSLRALGYDVIDEIHSLGLHVFADLKLFDISNTLATDGAFLREAKPELLTVVCATGVSGMKVLKAALPETEILGVTILTSLKEAETLDMFHATIEASAMKFALIAEEAGIDGLICAPTEIGLIRSVIKRSMSMNTPAIRPSWAIVPGDDQNPDRIMTPTKAIQAGADRIVVGRPIVRAENPYDAVMRTLEEIEQAIS